MSCGRLIGVGVGPGDPEHLTLKALRVLQSAERVFVPATDGEGSGRAERIIETHVPSDRIRQVHFAMSDHSTREQRWDEAGMAIAEVVRSGADAAFATIGDPNLFSTFTYVAETVVRLEPQTQVETVPGITAMQDLAARSSTVLAEGNERLALFPYTAGDEQLRAALAHFDTVVIYKGGRHIAKVRAALDDAGRLQESIYGEEVGLGGERILAGDGPSSAPYMSTVIAPARRRVQRGAALIDSVAAEPAREDRQRAGGRR